MTWFCGAARFFSMTEPCDTLRSLYISELRVLFGTEVLLLRTWPGVSNGATTPALQQAFSAQLGKTHIHLSELERIFGDLSQTASDGNCDAMAAIIAEAQRYLETRGDSDVRDAALIIAARKIHHYKAATCAAVSALALRLGDTGAAARLRTMLDDEHAADQDFSKIADSSVNQNAGNYGKVKADFDVSIF